MPRGRKPKPKFGNQTSIMESLSLEVERELVEGDMQQLQHLPANSPPPLKTITARHRRTAQLVAAGKPDVEIAETLGYTPARIGQLKTDPSFQELVAYYYDQIHEETLADEKRFQTKLLAAGEQAIDEINQRLEDKPGEISIGELRQIAVMAADRTVAPPKSQNQPPPPQAVTLNFNLPDHIKLSKPKIINQSGEEE